MSRRWILLGLCLLMLTPHGIAKATVLRVLAWPGYVSPAVLAAFEHHHQVEVELTTIDSDDTLWEKIRNPASPYDVFAVNTAELQRYIAAGLVQPIDPEKIPRLDEQNAAFRTPAAIPGLIHHGQLFAVPYTYAAMGLIYDPAQWPTPPRSIRALWDPHYQGKVLVYDGGTHNFTLAAQSLDLPDPFQLGEQDWRPVVDRLIALRRNVLTFYQTPEQSVRLFQRHHIALMLANYGSQQMRLMAEAGVKAGFTLPEEGALTWLDTWAIARRSTHPTLAHAWINAMLSAESAHALQDTQGLASTRALPAEWQPARIRWLKPVENPARRAALWQRIESGDQPDKLQTQVNAP
ncbi:PotD/PotF family extracellular solute-binding protein [Halothiobacillus sp. DCM-1]|uniref:ABC transporter substrate-binding protein n=1 Tax=Halothiobacillus sp. DCM-1 TaxID=3112558 RepID=UPI003249CB5F